ncbi:hypothetical protein FRB94_004786 [Tulasnella sp. JGI-2019a]|nr:hypothetical protein FRB94_004786 [Tulasnella sp. JGI-2019a]KAG9015387.1 hypothetical protein FRB93_013087 [Tulasnella sp. JGI-2019a]KAG9033364.1 hypothetical protein FRB95_014906 [Tulasnella sp. JGI-2019a]
MAMPPDSGQHSRASLKAWWKQFTFVQRLKKDTAAAPPNPYTARISSGSTVFGKPLRESLKYASVHISTATATGDLYVWGYIPVVVAKCGLYLKENGTEIEGTFRVNGSNKRMRELQALFDTPPRYGKDIEWNKKQFTTHDVASVFRRYLTQMPEPIIPHDRYHDFRDVMARNPPLSEADAIQAYKKLIQSLPPANQYLLLYVLDLLSVFARKADKNLMTAQNLATVFRPGVINHPTDEMSPSEHRLSQQVLEFLIAQQDWFMLDVPPPKRQDSIVGSLQPTAQDVLIVPTTKGDDPAEGTWKMVEPAKLSANIDRRRTTASTVTRGSVRVAAPMKGGSPRSDGLLVVAEDDGGLRRKGSLDVRHSGDQTLGVGDASVKRSTTVPSRHSSFRTSVADHGPPTPSPRGSVRRRLRKPSHEPDRGQ